MFEAILADVKDFALEHEIWIRGFAWSVFFLGIVQNLVYALQLPAAWLEIRRHSQAEDTESAWQLLISDVAMPISVIVPAYNEEAIIVESVQSMLSLNYPETDLIVINDGSSDQSLNVLIDAFSLKPVHRAHELSVPHAPVRGLYGSKLYPQLLVVDKENGRGKADATNAGVNFSRHPLFCVVDADSLLERKSLLRSVRPFMEDPQEMVAVGGTIRILNGCTVENGRIVKVGLPNQFLPLIQSMEYIRAFLMSRLAWSRWGVLLIISGAFGIFRRDLAIEVGGFSTDSEGEDYDLVIKLHRHLCDNQIPYKMRYVPEPVCWTQAPDSLKVLGYQRKRWQRGALQVMFKFRALLFNKRYGKLGLLGLPYHFLVDVLGPFAEIAGYILIPIFWALGLLEVEYVVAYVAIFFVFGIFISVATLVLEEMELRRTPSAWDLTKIGFIAVIENFGYRQLNNIWRMIGWWQFLTKQKPWGEMKRTSFSDQ